MRKSLLLSVALLASMLTTNRLQAQDIVIDAELRPRFEYRDGYQKPLSVESDPAMPIFQRTRLGMGYKSDLLNAKITLQDSRVWGQSNVDVPSTGNLGLFEAWAEVKFTSHFSVTAGRQAIKYDQNRLFSASSWTHTGKSHDLLLFKYHHKGARIKVDLGLAYNNPSNIKNEEIFYDNAKLYKSMKYGRFEKSFGEGWSVSAIYIKEKIEKELNGTEFNYGRNTTGANLVLSSKENPFGLILTGYYQFGKTLGSASLIDLSSYFLAAKVNYKFAEKFSAYLGYDQYSGTDYENIGKKSNTWQKLYGSNHSFNGSMEYWRDIKDYGLHDIYGGVNIGLSKKVSTDIGYHFFMTQKDAMFGEKLVDACVSLGSELDISLSWKIMKYAKLDCGWSTYFNSSNTKIVKSMDGIDTRFQQWAFVSLTINPELFNSKNFQRK